MNEKIETPTPWPFAPGQIVRDSGEGDDAAWLECAPVGTVVSDNELGRWTHAVMPGEHPAPTAWKRGAITLVAARLMEGFGPVAVVSVPEPTTTLHACTVDETAGGAGEVPTALVERAAEAILDAAYGQELPEAPIDLARAALAAVLPEVRAQALREAADEIACDLGFFNPDVCETCRSVEALRKIAARQATTTERTTT